MLKLDKNTSQLNFSYNLDKWMRVPDFELPVVRRTGECGHLSTFLLTLVLDSQAMCSCTDISAYKMCNLSSSSANIYRALAICEIVSEVAMGIYVAQRNHLVFPFSFLFRHMFLRTETVEKNTHHKYDNFRKLKISFCSLL